MNTHLSYGSTSIYRNYAQVEAKLAKLGVRYIRDGIHPGQAFHHQELRRLAGMGIKTNVIVGDPLQRWGTGSLATQLAIVRTQLPGAVASLEGANEYDNQGDANWVTNLRNYQRELYTLAKADPVLRSIPVVGPSFVRRESHGLLGDISPWTDYGNIHPYPRRRQPGPRLAHGSRNHRPARRGGKRTPAGHRDRLPQRPERGQQPQAGG